MSEIFATPEARAYWEVEVDNWRRENAEQARKEARQAYFEIAPPPGQFAATLLTDLDERACSLAGRAAAARFVETWEERRKAGDGLTLSGSIGCGKTMVAAAIANEIAWRGFAARFISVTGLQARLKRWEDADKVLTNLKRSHLLVLDDFGQERVTEWSSAQLFDLIDARNQARLPTIVTTNLGPADLRAHYVRALTLGKDQMPADQAGITVDRILSRLRERNASVIHLGDDQRAGGDHPWLTP